MPTDALAQTQVTPAMLKRLKMAGAIALLSAKTGTILAKYQSILEAAERIAESTPSTKVASCKISISEILSGRKQTPSYKGNYFRYIGDTISPMPTFPIVITRQNKYPARETETDQDKRNAVRDPILQFCAKTGRQLGTFETATDAAKALSPTISGSNVGQFKAAISNILTVSIHIPFYKGFYFRYSNDKTGPLPEFPIPETQADWNKTERDWPVLQFCAQTGKRLGIFDSQAEAATTLAKTIPGSTKPRSGKGICQVLDETKKDDCVHRLLFSLFVRK